MSKSPNDQQPLPPARVFLEVNLRPGMPVEEVARLQELADAQGVSLEAMMIRGIRCLLAAEAQPAVAA